MVPEKLAKYAGIFGSDSYHVYEVIESRDVNIHHLKQKEIERQQEESKRANEERERKIYEELKKKFEGCRNEADE